MQILERLLSYIFPDSCVGCAARGSLLCPSCEKQILPARKNSEEYISSAFSFADKKVQRLVWLLKYKNGQRVADILGPHMARSLEVFLKKNVQQKLPVHGIVVPIPLSKERYRERGYNQAELLARSMVNASNQFPSSNLSFRVETHVLTKTHNTFAQAKVRQRTVRQKNISDCFLVQAGRVSVSSIIILVDDVTTTGTTLTEARKALKKAGFQYVYAQTAAH